MSSPDDHDEPAVFRSAMAGVRLQGPAKHVPPQSRRPSTQPTQSQLDDLAVLAEMLDGPDPENFESGDTLTYRAPGIQDSVWKRLRRGGYVRQAELDLHGLNRDKAKLAIVAFLARCADRDHRCVRIIHGKGNGSPNSGPVLKRLLDGWLRKRRDVLAFASARPEDGGTGAVYVLLRRPD
ncbi:Smr/MutS family protein [Hydrocarboniphaga sp.]|uniref:Smr/MutS family protein n=1 Tax=Hydrocarboniphaga sp. TaxID=2033016 RepID=UPI003D0FB734